jgi:hypothetical protein
MSDQPKEKVESWSQRIQQWKQSGKSLAQWSRENDFIYSQTLYWKMRFLGSKSKTVVPNQFIELQDDQATGSGIIIETEGVRVHVATDFDTPTLLRCLALLKGKAC